VIASGCVVDAILVIALSGIAPDGCTDAGAVVLDGAAASDVAIGARTPADAVGVSNGELAAGFVPAAAELAEPVADDAPAWR
jgi:hypothetical protein